MTPFSSSFSSSLYIPREIFMVPQAPHTTHTPLSRFKENSLGNQTPSAAAAAKLLSYKTSFPKSPLVPPPLLPNNSPSLSVTGKKEWSAFFSVFFSDTSSSPPLPLQRNVDIVFACWWRYLKGETCCCCYSWEMAGRTHSWARTPRILRAGGGGGVKHHKCRT